MSKEQRCTEKFEECRVTNSWDPKSTDLVFVARMMTAYLPKGDKSSQLEQTIKKPQQANDVDDPSLLSGGAQKEVQKECKKEKGGKGDKGGGWQRSGGAAESVEISKEELEDQLLQERAAVTEARLKLLDAKKSDNTRGAAAPLSDGWDA
jgi:hypothetical protein